MTGTRIRLTRAELYEKVWAAPMRTVAQELGLSAVGLANVCRKHKIPVPPAGHRTKIEVGHKIAPPPLVPELSGYEAVDIYVRERLSPELAALAAEVAPKVTIPQELSHALALKTKKVLTSGKQTEKKLIVPKTGTAPHLFVSREQLPRALRIMNALFLALEERGHAVSWPKGEGSILTVSVDGEAVTFCVREATDSVKDVLTPAEQKQPWMAPRWITSSPAGCGSPSTTCLICQGRCEGLGRMERFSAWKIASETSWLASRLRLLPSRRTGKKPRSGRADERKSASREKNSRGWRRSTNERPNSAPNSLRIGKKLSACERL